jgi:hypothetical protein
LTPSAPSRAVLFAENSLCRLHQFITEIGLGNNGVDANTSCLIPQDVISVESKKNHTGIGEHIADERSGLDAGHSGHREIKNDNFGAESFRLLDGFHAIAGFTANRKFGSFFDRPAHEAANDGIVVDEQDSMFAGDSVSVGQGGILL